MELLTLTEAAEAVGLSAKTIHRHILKGKIPTVDTPLGKRIPSSALGAYKDLRKDKVGQVETPVQDSPGQNGTGQEQNEPDLAGQVGRRIAQDRTEPDSGGQAMVPLAAHLAALELANRLQDQAEKLQQQMSLSERRRVALEMQLQQYQMALSEHADSLAEERTRRLALEAQREPEFVPQPPPTEALKVSTPKDEPSWGRRLSRWLFRKVG